MLRCDNIAVTIYLKAFFRLILNKSNGKQKAILFEKYDMI